MKKIVILVLLASVSLMSMEYKKFEEAIALAKKTDKMVLLGVVRDGCHYCEEMEERVKNSPEMIKYIDERFVTVKVNLSYEKVPLGLKVSMTPTFFFITSEKEVLKRVPGAWNLQDFTELLENAKVKR